MATTDTVSGFVAVISIVVITVVLCHGISEYLGHLISTNQINFLGFVGLVFSALGPLTIIIANISGIWRYQVNTGRLEQLKDAHDQAHVGSLSSDDPSFKTLYQLLNEYEDLPPRDTIDSIHVGGLGDENAVFYKPSNRNDPDVLLPVRTFDRLIEEQIQGIRDSGHQSFFIIGMKLLVLGFGLQAFAYCMRNPVL